MNMKEFHEYEISPEIRRFYLFYLYNKYESFSQARNGEGILEEFLWRFTFASKYDK